MMMQERVQEWQQQLQAEQTRVRQLQEALDGAKVNVERLTGAVMAARVLMDDEKTQEPAPAKGEKQSA